MNDPHVVALHYKLVLGEFVQFSPPAEPLEFQMADFHCTLRDTHLRLEPLGHYQTRDAAKGVVDPLIQAWAMEAAVRLNVPTLRIEYERTELRDRAPGPGTGFPPVVFRRHVLGWRTSHVFRLAMPGLTRCCSRLAVCGSGLRPQ
jgi:hypothetical protein